MERTNRMDVAEAVRFYNNFNPENFSSFNELENYAMTEYMQPTEEDPTGLRFEIARSIGHHHFKPLYAGSEPTHGFIMAFGGQHYLVEAILEGKFGIKDVPEDIYAKVFYYLKMRVQQQAGSHLDNGFIDRYKAKDGKVFSAYRVPFWIEEEEKEEDNSSINKSLGSLIVKVDSLESRLNKLEERLKQYN